jgi:hypothetical protein
LARTPLIAVGKYEQRVSQALLAGMKDLIGQIGFETDVACEEVRDESIHESRLHVKPSNHVRLRNDEHLRGGHSNRAVTPLAAADERLLTEDAPVPRSPQIASLPLRAVTANQTRPRSMCITVSHASPWRKMAARGP